MKLFRYYIVVILLVCSICLLIYNFIYLKSDIDLYEKKIQQYAIKYTYIKNDILKNKQIFNEFKKKSDLIKELQNINTDKFVPYNIDTINIIKKLEQFHNDKKITLNSIRIISTGEEDFNIIKLHFIKYRISILFDQNNNIDSPVISDYILKDINEFDKMFSFYYIENFNITSNMLEYDIKFYYKKQ